MKSLNTRLAVAGEPLQLSAGEQTHAQRAEGMTGWGSSQRTTRSKWRSVSSSNKATKDSSKRLDKTCNQKGPLNTAILHSSGARGGESVEHAFTGSRWCSNHLSFTTAIVDCFLPDAVLGYQPSLLCTHDAVPLTVNRSASPAQSEWPHVSTEPAVAIFTASRLSVVGRTVMISRFPRRYDRIDLMFLMSVSLARPRLDEAFTIAQRRSARSIHRSFPKSCRYTLGSLTGHSFSSVSRCSHRSVGVLLNADTLNSSSMLSTYVAYQRRRSTFPSFFTMSSSVGFVVTSLLSFSRCRLRSVRTSVMVWCVPASNKSSTWNASDLRFVGHVSSMFGREAALPEDLLQMFLPASRRASQTTEIFLSFSDHCAFAVI